ncbi:MAG: hypothetical protein PHH26_08570 [Candidatus Thermoplasmatota archaeon]|nr:hypothetical protein [Candidatus Thermoplasmatota archaeon]
MIDKEKLEKMFSMGIVIVAMVFAVVALVRLYMAVDSLIGIWFSYRYTPIFQALFSVAVLAVSVYVIKVMMGKK